MPKRARGDSTVRSRDAAGEDGKSTGDQYWEVTTLNEEPIKFYASLPPITGAIKTGGGEHDGSRITLEVPGTEIAQTVRLLGLRGKTFRVTIETD